MELVHNLKRMSQYFFKTLKISFIADLEFRANILLQVFNDVLWYISQIALFEILFRIKPQIGDWTLESTRIFMGIFFIVDTLQAVMFETNLGNISDHVRSGHLDFILTKPIPSQLMVSIYRMNPVNFINFFMVLTWFIYHLNQYSNSIPVERLIFMPILIFASVFIIYAIRMLFSTLTVIFVRADFIIYVWFQFLRMGSRPDDMYPNVFRYVMKSIIPVAFIASVPTKWLLFHESWYWVGLILLTTGLFLYLSHLFWNFALKKYTSASS